MKKVSKAFLLPLLCVVFGSLTSCSKNEQKVKLTYGEITHQKYHEISYARFERMIDNKESFLLVVDPKGCACFDSFMRASEEYIRDNKLVLYKMNVADFKGNENKGVKVVEGSTSFSIFNKGVIQQSIASNSSTEIMENKSKFVEYVDKYLEKPNMYLINKENLNTLYHSANKSLIYFARNSCGDCSYINANFLYEYMRGRSETLYVFDGDEEVRRYDDKGKLINEEEWIQFKVDYGLTTDNNPTYGYSTGVVPTFFLVSGNSETTTFHSGAVAFNETIEKVDNEYKVSEVYFSNARQSSLEYARNFPSMEGMKVNANDIIESEKGYRWKQSASSAHYFPRIQAFLDSYLIQVTHKF